MTEQERYTVINQFSHYFSIRDNRVGINIVNRIMTRLDAEWLCYKLNELIRENEELKQQLADIDKLIYELGHNEMQRQYEEITKENGEDD